MPLLEQTPDIRAVALFEELMRAIRNSVPAFAGRWSVYYTPGGSRISISG